jgi:hypothetical protein
MTELEWLEMASPRLWARVYTLKAQTNCTLEHAIQAVQATDKDGEPGVRGGAPLANRGLLRDRHSISHRLGIDEAGINEQ